MKPLALAMYGLSKTIAVILHQLLALFNWIFRFGNFLTVDYVDSLSGPITAISAVGQAKVVSARREARAHGQVKRRRMLYG